MTAQEAVSKANELWQEARQIHKEKGFAGSIQPLLVDLREIDRQFSDENDPDCEVRDEIKKCMIDMRRWAR